MPRKDTALGLVGKRAESAVPRERQESDEKKRLKKVDNLDEICNRTSKSALYIGSEGVSVKARGQVDANSCPM